MKRGRLNILPALAIGSILSAAPLQAQFVYVANTDKVVGYSIDQNTGALMQVPGSPFAAGGQPFSVTVDPTSKYVYVTNHDSANVSGYKIGSKGTLTPVPGSPFTAGVNPSAVAVDAMSRFVYVANQGGSGTGNASAYSIDCDGALTPVPGSPFPVAAGQPFAVAVDPLAQFVYFLNPGADNTVFAYTISSTGTLARIKFGQVYTGQEPVSLAVGPTGRYAYVTSAASNQVSAYIIEPGGALTPVASSPFGAGSEPSSVAVDPTDKFVYVANKQGSSISAYRIDHATEGVLLPVPGSPFSAINTHPKSIAVDPSARFVYVAAGTAGILAYGIDPRTGALTLLPGSPFPPMARDARSIAITKHAQ